MPPNELSGDAAIPKLLTLIEVAESLRLSPHTIRSFVRKGKLRPVRICRRLLFNPSDVEQLVAENSEPRGTEQL